MRSGDASSRSVDRRGCRAAPAPGCSAKHAHQRVEELRRLHAASRAAPTNSSARARLRQPAERGERGRAAGRSASRCRRISRASVEPVHLGHHACRGRRRRTARRAAISSSASAAELDRHRLHAPRRGLAADDLAVRRVVVDDEQPLARRAACAVERRVLPAASASFAVSVDVEGRALAVLALDPESAAHQLDQALGDREPEARCRRSGASSTRRPG